MGLLDKILKKGNRSTEESSSPGLFGRFLVERGLINDQQLAAATQAAVSRQSRLGTVVYELGFLNLPTLGNALGEHLGIASAPASMVLGATPEDAQRITAQMALEFRALSLGLQDGRLVVAMANPKDSQALNEIARHAGASVRPMVAAEVLIFYGLRKLYDQEIPPRMETLCDELENDPTAGDTARPRGGVPIDEVREMLTRYGLEVPGPQSVPAVTPEVQVEDLETPISEPEPEPEPDDAPAVEVNLDAEPEPEPEPEPTPVAAPLADPTPVEAAPEPEPEPPTPVAAPLADPTPVESAPEPEPEPEAPTPVAEPLADPTPVTQAEPEPAPETPTDVATAEAPEESITAPSAPGDADALPLGTGMDEPDEDDFGLPSEIAPAQASGDTFGVPQDMAPQQADPADPELSPWDEVTTGTLLKLAKAGLLAKENRLEEAADVYRDILDNEQARAELERLEKELNTARQQAQQPPPSEPPASPAAAQAPAPAEPAPVVEPAAAPEPKPAPEPVAAPEPEPAPATAVSPQAAHEAAVGEARSRGELIHALLSAALDQLEVAALFARDADDLFVGLTAMGGKLEQKEIQKVIVPTFVSTILRSGANDPGGFIGIAPDEHGNEIFFQEIDRDADSECLVMPVLKDGDTTHIVLYGDAGPSGIDRHFADWLRDLCVQAGEAMNQFIEPAS